MILHASCFFAVSVRASPESSTAVLRSVLCPIDAFVALSSFPVLPTEDVAELLRWDHTSTTSPCSAAICAALMEAFDCLDQQYIKSNGRALTGAASIFTDFSAQNESHARHTFFRPSLHFIQMARAVSLAIAALVCLASLAAAFDLPVRRRRERSGRMLLLASRCRRALVPSLSPAAPAPPRASSPRTSTRRYRMCALSRFWMGAHSGSFPGLRK